MTTYVNDLPTRTNYDSTHNSIAQLAGTLTDEDLLNCFPTGMRTPGAVYLRIIAYMSTPCAKAKEIITAVKAARMDDSFAPNTHKRSALTCLTAILIHCMNYNDSRELTEKMKKMIADSFPGGFCDDVVRLLTLRRDKEISWKKDGGVVKLDVCTEAFDDNDLVMWAGTKWIEPGTASH